MAIGNSECKKGHRHKGTEEGNSKEGIGKR